MIEVRSPYARPAPTTEPRPPRIVFDKEEGEQLAAEASARRWRMGRRGAALAVLGLSSWWGGSAVLTHIELRPPPPIAMTQPTAVQPLKAENGVPSADGSFVADANRDGQLKVINGRTGETIPTPAGEARTLGWIGQSNVLAWMDFKGTVTAWDASTQTVRWTTSVPQGREYRYRDGRDGLVSSSDGRWLIATTPGYDSKMFVIDAAKGEIRHQQTQRYQTPSFVADNRMLMLYAEQNTQLLSTEDFKPVGPALRVGYRQMPGLSPDGQSTAVPVADEVVIQNTRSGEKISKFSTSYAVVGAPTFSPDGQLVAVSTKKSDSNRGELVVARAATGDVVFTAPTRSLSSSPVFSPDGSTVMIADHHDEGFSVLRAYNTSNGDRTWQIRMESRASFTPIFSKDGSRLAVLEGAPQSYYDNRYTLSIFDMTTRTPVARYQLANGQATEPQPTPDGALLMAVDGNRSVRTFFKVPSQ